MTIDYGDFTRASDLIHRLQGGALLALGAAEAYAQDNKGKKAVLAASLLFTFAGAAMLAAVLALPGGWSLEQLATALQARRGFHLFIAFSCLYCAAGLSRFMQESFGRAAWRSVFLFLLALIVGLYFALAWRVNEEAWRQVLVWHSAIGFTLLLAVAVKSADIFLRRRALRLAWAVLLMMAGLQLVSYREAPGAFAPRLVTLESAPEIPPVAVPKNAKTADKKRPGN